MRRGAASMVALALIGCLSHSTAAAPRQIDATRLPVPIAEHTAFEVTGTLEQGGLATGLAPVDAPLTLDGRPVPVAPDGRFIVAFDRDAGPVAELRYVSPNGVFLVQRLTIAPRAWRIERLPTLPRHAQPEPEFEALRAPEAAAIAAARATVTDAAGWRQSFRWPVAGRQSGWFGSQRIYAGEPGSYHTGADIAVPDGTPVAAPADGVVILAADHPFTLEGNLLMIDHGMGLSTALLHLSRIDVAVGEHVRQGQIVGRSGHSGRATGPHLHWGLRWRDARLDPLLVAGSPPPR
ncbi:M23 family metallopeptidase [uncultured Sphingomonas sp.]|uniref:M23 family metallopeptidase n=1 Tax=uncultured Sphingomonas sp. TaxID=158754 RepID=UPI0035CC4AC5